VIEILSQNHKIEDILDKFFSYFTSVVKSCWLVIPVAGSVIVYSSPDHARRFTTGDIVDKQLNIQVPLQEIFE
jgi:Uma2 family endonuclease